MTTNFVQLTATFPHLDSKTVEDLMHETIVAVTGLQNSLVRPRWQADPPEVPEPEVSWCAFGVTSEDAANFPYIEHGDGQSLITDTSEINILVSFYGVNHRDYAKKLRMGLHVQNNLHLLRKAGIAFVKAGNISNVPAQVALGWRARADLNITLRLETRCSFIVPNIEHICSFVTADFAHAKAPVPTGCNACNNCKK